MNIIARRKFEHAYYNVAVMYFSHYVTETPLLLLRIIIRIIIIIIIIIVFVYYCISDRCPSLEIKWKQVSRIV